MYTCIEPLCGELLHPHCYLKLNPPKSLPPSLQASRVLHSEQQNKQIPTTSSPRATALSSAYPVAVLPLSPGYTPPLPSPWQPSMPRLSNTSSSNWTSCRGHFLQQLPTTLHLMPPCLMSDDLHGGSMWSGFLGGDVSGT